MTLHLRGAFAVSTLSGAGLSALSRRGQAMLAFLSQQRGMKAERARLADVLWSDRSDDQARASLRQELSLLRKSLPDGILDSNRQFVWLNPERVSVDLSGDEEFLAGFDLGSEGFEDWMRDVRATLGATKTAEAPPGEKFFSRPAVLLFAFETLSSGETDSLVAAGLAEDLKTTLSYWRWFPVIGPEAIGWKTAKDCNVLSVAAEVGADYCVTGSVRCLGDKVRVTVSLMQTASGRALWSENFDGSLEEVLAFQDEASRSIVAQLEPQIAKAEATRIERMRTGSITPWQLLAKADDIDRKGGEGYGTPESNFRQMRLMEEALAISPDFSPAFARLGRLYFRAALLGWMEDRADTFAKSLENTTRALRIDPDDWEAHAYTGLVRIFGTHEYEAGRFHGAEAVRLNPSAALARHAAGCALEWIGAPEDALAHLNLIFRLNPSYNGRAAALGDITTCELFLGNREAAMSAARKLLAIAPNYARGLQRCVATFGYFDEPGLAAEALGKLHRLQPDFGEKYVRETYPYARHEDLEALMEGLRKAGAF